jgi:hypothetical protein
MRRTQLLVTIVFALFVVAPSAAQAAVPTLSAEARTALSGHDPHESDEVARVSESDAKGRRPA